ncbi:hypothetical protein Hanom_Chr11g00995701 [Helianthus anomalus]
MLYNYQLKQDPHQTKLTRLLISSSRQHQWRIKCHKNKPDLRSLYSTTINII